MNEIDKIIKKPFNKLASVYLIYGEDDLLLNQFQNKFKEFFAKNNFMSSFNISFLADDQEDFVFKLKNYLMTLPVNADKRLVIASCENYFLQKNEADSILKNLFSNFPDSSILLIKVKGKIDRRLSLNKAVGKIGRIINLQPPRFQDLDKWILNSFRKKEKSIDKKSVKLLEHMFNNNLERLHTEIDKITTCFIDKNEIRYSDIIKIVSRDRLLKDDIIFTFLDAFSKRDRVQSLKILNEMLYAGEYPLKILTMITRQLRLLISIKELKNMNYRPDKIAKILKEHPYPVKKCYNFCDNFSKEELFTFMERALEANYAIVSGKYSQDQMALEMILFKM